MGTIDLDVLSVDAHSGREDILARILDAPEVVEADLWVGDGPTHRRVTELLASLSPAERAALDPWPGVLFSQLTEEERREVLAELHASMAAAS